MSCKVNVRLELNYPNPTDEANFPVIMEFPPNNAVFAESLLKGLSTHEGDGFYADVGIIGVNFKLKPMKYYVAQSESLLAASKAGSYTTRLCLLAYPPISFDDFMDVVKEHCFSTFITSVEAAKRINKLHEKIVPAGPLKKKCCRIFDISSEQFDKFSMEELEVIANQSLVSVNGQDTFNPRVMLLLRRTSVDVPSLCTSWVQHFHLNDGLYLKSSPAVVDYFLKMPVARLICVMQLCKDSNLLGKDAKCFLCLNEGSHASLYCPRYPTYRSRIDHVLSYALARCVGCNQSGCTIGNGAHDEDHANCLECKNTYHVHYLCPSPSLWSKIRERINRIHCTGIATKSWTMLPCYVIIATDVDIVPQKSTLFEISNLPATAQEISKLVKQQLLKDLSDYFKGNEIPVRLSTKNCGVPGIGKGRSLIISYRNDHDLKYQPKRHFVIDVNKVGIMFYNVRMRLSPISPNISPEKMVKDQEELRRENFARLFDATPTPHSVTGLASQLLLNSSNAFKNAKTELKGRSIVSLLQVASLKESSPEDALASPNPSSENIRVPSLSEKDRLQVIEAYRLNVTTNNTVVTFIADEHNHSVMIDERLAISPKFLFVMLEHSNLSLYKICYNWSVSNVNEKRTILVFPPQVVDLFLSLPMENRSILCELNVWNNKMPIECFYCEVKFCHFPRECPLYITKASRIARARNLIRCTLCFEPRSCCQKKINSHSLSVACSTCNLKNHVFEFCNSDDAIAESAMSIFKVHTCVCAMGLWDIDSLRRCLEKMKNIGKN